MLRPAIFALMLGMSLPATGQTAVPATSTISHEPYFADLVDRAGKLKAQTERLSASPALSLLERPDFKTYTQQIRALSDGDLQGHLALKKRGTDNDLKCIMKGLSLDLNIKMDAILASKSDADLGRALGNMAALLRDNIDVIVTPATADSGLDCVIEFGNT
ncbi:hypothetical protein AEAC466_01970 [Asticcacaulis sp. AC466]|uniref:hypothetical protein n=1 Tax=Asticcacaulis sp. AC466 TaxID=1282362 RepID=UPI0003C412DC|nr:hypothetical protein [Asticcacaulis sp. AC466]ESQ85974.1 hypothetical protein AEAC466_01970 [Asticcacaulis sp. AC466]